VPSSLLALPARLRGRELLRGVNGEAIGANDIAIRIPTFAVLTVRFRDKGQVRALAEVFGAEPKAPQPDMR
jgi:hypothetical protein